MDIFEAISTRRSIRKYKTDPVDDRTVETILEAARQAPSWANTQCWRFIVVRNSDTKTQLAEALLSFNPAQKPNAYDAVKNAPVVIVAVAEKGVSGSYGGKTTTDKGDTWYMYDVALAMENLSLAAAASGLGTVHLGLFDVPKVASILGIPDSYAVVTMTPLGYPEVQPSPRPRKELTEIVFHEKFGQG